jgi:hypothetical protein
MRRSTSQVPMSDGKKLVTTIYTRTFADREGEESIMQNTNDAVAHVEKLLADFRSDRVTRQPY